MTITAEGRRIRTNLVTAAVAAMLVILALVVLALFGGSEAVSGPDGSSFVTTPQGTAGLAELLEEAGADVVRSRVPLLPDTLAGADALVAVDVGSATYGQLEVDAIRRFVEQGGTAVLAGRPNPDLISALVGEEIDWSAATALGGRLTVGDGDVSAGRFGVFPAGPGLPLAVADDRDLIVALSAGRGRVFLFADSATLSNDGLDRADNADIALRSTGTGRVVFDEFRHGFTEEGRTGLVAAAPAPWRNAGLLAVVALAVALVTYGRRFGPPEPEGRDFVPGRGRLLAAVGSTLRRTGSPVSATEPVRAEALRRIRRRAMLHADATDAELRSAASALLPPDEVSAIFDPTPDTVLAADRALARLDTIDGELMS